MNRNPLQDSHPFTWKRRIVILGAIIILAFAFQGARGIFSPDEGFYATIASSMVEEGDYLIPRLNHEVWLDKPPLSLWGIAAGIHIFGHNEWGARFFHALCFLFTIGLVFLLGRALYGKVTGWLSAVFYSTMVIPFAAANIITPDTPLTLWTTATFFLFWKSVREKERHAWLWKILLGMAFGLGFLTKGPAALVPGFAMVAFLVFSRRTRRFLWSPAIPVGLALFILIGMGWYIFISRQVPGSLTYLWNNQVVGRTVSSRYARNPQLVRGLLYLPVILLGTLPWSFFWLSPSWHNRKSFIRKQWWTSLRNNPAGLFLATCIVAPLFVLFLASSKLPLYALPLFPALAIISARAWAYARRRDGPEEKARRLAHLVTLILALWAPALIGLKFASAHVPSEKNMRDLYTAIRPYMPSHPYEVVAVNEHLDALTFYNILNVERVTTSEIPYPFFVTTEHLDEEIEELRDSEYGHVFIIKRESRVSSLRDKLGEKHIAFREIDLPHERFLFVCQRASSMSNEVRVVALGDTGRGKGESNQFILASTLYLKYGEKSFNDGVILLGDNLYMRSEKGTPPDIARIEFEEPFEPLLKIGVPFYAALGNHDLGHGLEDFELHYPLFHMKGRHYYSIKMGNDLVEFFMLDSNTLNRKDVNQIGWIEKALAASRANWKIVALHHPIRTTGSSHPPSPEKQEILEPLFKKYGVSIVFQGHNHLYERLAPIDGIHYFTVGGSGTVDVGGLKPDAPERIAGNDQTLVFLLMEFSNKDARFTAYDRLGNIIDESEISLHE